MSITVTPLDVSSTSPKRQCTPDTKDEQAFWHYIVGDSLKLFSMMCPGGITTADMVLMQGELVTRMMKRLILLDEINKQK
jgi:MoxR-like ATPase